MGNILWKMFLFVFALTSSAILMVMGSESEPNSCPCTPTCKHDDEGGNVGKWVIGTLVGVGTVAAAPAVLAAAGFTSAGIAAGSLAAGIQSTFYGGAASGFFATLQSAGAAGLGAVTKTVLGGAATAAASKAMEMDSGCSCQC